MSWLFVFVFFILYYMTPDRWKHTVLFFWSLWVCVLVSPVFFIMILVYTSANFFTARYLQWNRKVLGGAKCFLLSMMVNGVMFIVMSFIFGRLFVLPLALRMMCGYVFLRMIYFHYGLYTRENRLSRNPLALVMYAVFFPLVAAGPVLSYGECRRCFRERHVSGRQTGRGFFVLFAGLSMILLLALPAGEAFMYVYHLKSEISVISWMAGLAFITCFLYYMARGYLNVVKGLFLILGMKMNKTIPDVLKNAAQVVLAVCFLGWGFHLYPYVAKAAGYLGRLPGAEWKDSQGRALLTGYAPLWILLILWASPLPKMVKRVMRERVASSRRLKMRMAVTAFMAVYSVGSLAGNPFFADANRQWAAVLGEREYNQVIRGRDHYLFETPADDHGSAMEARTAAMNNFAETLEDIPVFVMVSPDSADINTDKISPQTPIRSQGDDLKTIRALLGDHITWVEVEENLKKNKNEILYFRTAPYWNNRGAYYGYDVLKSAMNLDEDREYPLKEYIVSGEFNGELSKKSGYYKGYREELSLFLPKDQNTRIKTLVTFPDQDQTSVSIYDSEKLRGDNGYDVFFGGNHGEVRIKTTADSNARLLMIKDGYGSPLVPFLLPHFREIIMIDPEYYQGSLKNILESERVTQVLFVYGCNHFFREEKLEEVL